jgi:preprotein translocase subunit Sec63
MTIAEMAVILVGLIAVYFAVSKLFFPKPKVDKVARPVPPPSVPPAWCEILQVPPDADAADIRDAYKHLISKYHPDKVDNSAQEIKDLAGQKSQDITAAYREGMRARGEEP